MEDALRPFGASIFLQRNKTVEQIIKADHYVCHALCRKSKARATLWRLNSTDVQRTNEMSIPEEKFGIFGASFESSDSYVNPNMELEAEAEIKRPDGYIWTIPLFRDGGWR